MTKPEITAGPTGTSSQEQQWMVSGVPAIGRKANAADIPGCISLKEWVVAFMSSTYAKRWPYVPIAGTPMTRNRGTA
jgi:hypothetical protein